MTNHEDSMNTFNDKAIQKFDTELTSGNVKAAMAAATAKSRDLWQVPIDHIQVVEGFNPRIHDAAYDAHIEDIAQSILDNGFYQDKPLAGYVATVEGEQIIYVTEGSSRLAAARRAISMGASLETLPVAVKDRSTSMEDLTIALVKGNNGKRLNIRPRKLWVPPALEGRGRDVVKAANNAANSPST